VLKGQAGAVGQPHLPDSVQIHAFQARDIEAVLVGVAAPLVVRVDPAGLAELVLRRERVPLVERQVVGAFDDPKPVERQLASGKRNQTRASNG
jgi:hypothetical protein